MSQINRRHFMKMLAAAGVTATMSTPLSALASKALLTRVSSPTRVIVIGAGMAGLTAARALHEAGVEVVLLEARNRLGGRTHTAEVGGVPVDLGGAYIHGIDGSPISAFCDAYGLAYSPESSDEMQVHDVNRGELTSVAGLQMVRTVLAFIQAVPNLSAELGPGASLRNGVDAFLAAGRGSAFSDRKTRFVLEEVLGEVAWGGPPDRVSLENVLEGESLSGGNHMVHGGYVELVEAMAEGVDIHLGTPVTRIDRDDAGVVVHAGGQEWIGSHVIVSVPLGVLKAGSINFSGGLPEDKRAALSRMDMGSTEKVVMRFERAFWQDVPGREPYVLWMGEEWGEMPLFTDFTRHTGAPTLVAYYGGQWSRDNNPNLTDDELLGRTLDILGSIVGATAPEPLDYAVTRWGTDPYALGAYYYPAAGSSFEDSLTLAEPVDGRILFAGEATAYPFTSTVHGAMLSGLREAQRLGVDDIAIPGLEGFRHGSTRGTKGRDLQFSWILKP